MSVELNHRISGQGEPLILLHGLFGSLQNLGGIGRRLEDGWQIHALDQRNHGSSPHTSDREHPALAADGVADRDATGVDKASRVGHSLGGDVATPGALSHPERGNAIIVADIAPVTYPPRHDAVLDGMKNLDLRGVRSRNDADARLAEFVEIAGVRQFLLKNLERIPSDEQAQEDLTFRWRLNLPV